MAMVTRRLDTLQTVELAEGMEVHLRIAGPFLRLYAYLIDLVIVLATTVMIMLIVGGFSIVVGENVAVGILMLALFFLFWFYPIFFEVSRKGATPGKMILGLRVVNEAGGILSVGSSMVRNFIRIVELFFPFLPLVAFLNPRFQRLGDLAAGSLVIYSRELDQPIYGGPPALDSIPVTIALTREERAAIIAFRHRSGSWSEARREELVNYLTPLTGNEGPKGVSATVEMAHWLENNS